MGYFDKKTEIEVGDLTLICGKNNTGKTYASYAIYGFLATWQENIRFQLNQNEIENLINNGVLELNLQKFEKDMPIVLEELSRRYTQVLPSISPLIKAHHELSKLLKDIVSIRHEFISQPYCQKR
ncbi:MAG: AAA family ATPase [Pseudomonadota bacterium]